MKQRIIYFLSIFTLLGSLNNVMAQEEYPVTYTAMYRYNHIHCTFLVNEMPIHSSIPNRPVMISFMGRIGALLAEGENTFGIWAMNIPEDPKNAYCEMIVNAEVYNPETKLQEQKEVASLRITIDENGDFVTTESKTYPEPTVAGAISIKEKEKPTFKQGTRNDVVATRGLMVNHPHKHYSWTHKSTPFKDTPENREKLWAKYEEFRVALAAKDEKRYRALLQPGASETENYMGDPATGSFLESTMEFVHDAWEAKDFKVMTINKENYYLVIGANGRLFRFIGSKAINKMNSPIVYHENNTGSVFNYTFTLIDGEIVNAY